MLCALLRLWKDESGAVIAMEYLMLGSIVSLGAAAGMAEIRDTTINEYKELGQSIHQTREAYTLPSQRSGAASTTGSKAINRGLASDPANFNAQGVAVSYPMTP